MSLYSGEREEEEHSPTVLHTAVNHYQRGEKDDMNL